jgi:predicted unusual protein kinase regulating ubiquinone biosynthesis (AarF/ABC1/UbiB family)
VHPLKRDQVWQAPFYERLFKEAARFAALAPDPLRFCEREWARLVPEREGEDRFVRRLNQLIYLLLGLEHSSLEKATEPTVLNKVKKAERLLIEEKIDPSTSRLSFLWAEIYERLARLYEAAPQIETAAPGRFLAAWHSALAQEIRGHRKSPAIAVPELHAERAVPVRFFAGDWLELAVESSDEWAQAALSGDLGPLLRNLKRGEHAHAEKAFLLAHAVRSRKWISHPSVRLLAGRSRSEVRETLRFLSSHSDRSSLAPQELRELGASLSQVIGLADAELQLLILASHARLLHRSRCGALRDLLLQLYRQLSLKLSDRLNDDAFGAVGDMCEVPNEQRNRSLSVGSLTLKLAVTVGTARLRQLFSDGKQAKRLKEDERRSVEELLAGEMKKLRGPIMKVGQTLSYFGFSERLAELQREAEPLAEGVAVEVIERELSVQLSSIFSEFDPRPFSCGSIGQVHRATLRATGEAVAVKVQYPGIRQAILSDLSILKTALPVAALLYPRLDLQAIFRELREGLESECNYLREARNQAVFRERFAPFPEIHIPRVYGELSTQRVLVTERVEAEPLSSFIGRASEEERAAIALAAGRFVISSCRDGFLNSDPHPGNFGVRDGRLVCFDFGNVKRWSLEEREAWRAGIEAGVLADRELFRKAIRGIGVINASNRVDLNQAFATFMGDCMSRFAEDRAVRFDTSMIHQELGAIFSRKNPNSRTMNMRPSYLFGMRVYYGLIALLSSFDVRINWHQETLKLLRGELYSRESLTV